MKKYLLNDDLQKEVFYVHDDGKDIIIRDDLDDVPEKDRGKYSEEWIEFRIPSWLEISSMTEASTGGMSPFPNQQMIDRTLIMMFLHKASFYEIERGKPDEDSPEQITNAEEMLGSNGLVPVLVNKILLTLRRRM